jgi:hypothetical protein
LVVTTTPADAEEVRAMAATAMVARVFTGLPFDVTAQKWRYRPKRRGIRIDRIIHPRKISPPGDHIV